MTNKVCSKIIPLLLLACLFVTGCEGGSAVSGSQDYTELRAEYSGLAKVLENIASRSDDAERPCAHTRVIYNGDAFVHWKCCAACNAVMGDAVSHTPSIKRELGVGHYNVFVKVCSVCNSRYEMILTEKNYTYVIEEYGKGAN